MSKMRKWIGSPGSRNPGNHILVEADKWSWEANIHFNGKTVRVSAYDKKTAKKVIKELLALMSACKDLIEDLDGREFQDD